MAKYNNRTTSGQVHVGYGRVYGFIVNSHTSGTLKLWDSQTAAFSVIMNTFTFPTGSGVYMFNSGNSNSDEVGIEYNTGLFATIGGTADITILYSPRS